VEPVATAVPQLPGIWPYGMATIVTEKITEACCDDIFVPLSPFVEIKRHQVMVFRCSCN